jgi:hypothetical protein
VVATTEATLTDNIGKIPEGWRNHWTKHPIAASRLRRGDLRRLYRLINDKQLEYRDRFMPVLQQQPDETSEVFKAHAKNVSMTHSSRRWPFIVRTAQC